MTPSLQVAHQTNVGRRRSQNQDAVLVQPLEADGKQDRDYLLAVADGVGGLAGGQVASREALLALAETVTQPGLRDDPGARLGQAFRDANVRVHELARQDPELNGMATTLVVAVVLARRVWLANAGDSRAYLVHAGVIRALTTDHSWVREQVQAGRMSAAEAARDPRRNIITRAVGTDPNMRPEIYEAFSLASADVLLLCSDGLHGVVAEARIAAVVSKYPPEGAVRELVRLANEQGGPDNITVIVASAGADVGRVDPDSETLRTAP
jgi:PPM family protein phosphatase